MLLDAAGGFRGQASPPVTLGHPPAGFANAGEKIFFWLLFFGGLALTISGFYLLFPNLETVRETMQFWHIIHLSTGLLIIGGEGRLDIHRHA